MKLLHFLYSVIFFLVVLCVLAKLNIPDSNIIIALIGALATFVVVGNYAQVKEIETKFRSEVKQIKDNYNTQTNELKREIEAQIKATEFALQKRADGILLHYEILDDLKSLRKQRDLFNPRLHELAMRLSPSSIEKMEYDFSFAALFDKCLEVLKNIRKLKNEYEEDVKNEVAEVLELAEDALSYIKLHSLRVCFSLDVIEQYVEVLRNTPNAPFDVMVRIIEALQSLRLPPDADHPTNNTP